MIIFEYGTGNAIYSFSSTVLLLFLGAAHGFYLTVIALVSARQVKANLFLSIFIFAYSYILLNAFLFESGYMIHLRFLMGTSMPFQFLVGPAFFFYVAFVLGEKSEFKRVDYLHLLLQ